MLDSRKAVRTSLAVEVPAILNNGVSPGPEREAVR